MELDHPSHARRIREWPNRLGIAEHGGATDVVVWHRDLLARAPEASDVRCVGALVDPNDLAERTRWFQKLLKRLEQIRGVTSYVQPEAPCGILLTPGITRGRLRSIPDAFAPGIASLEEVLPEFPGGLQLRLTDLGWARAQEYAEVIEHLLREDG